MTGTALPRTTLDIDTTVLTELKRRGEIEGKTIGRLASELLAKALAKSGEQAAEPFEWPVSDEPMQPRIDLEDKDALWAALDADGTR